MKKLIKFFSYVLVMLSLLIFFLPKINLYYAAEALMKQKNVYISDEEAFDKGFTLELKHAKVFFDKLALADVESIRVSPLFFYNVLNIDNIHVNEGFSDFLPQEVKNVRVEHFIFNPVKVKFRGESEDSHFYGNVNLLKRMLSVHIRLGVISEKKYGTMLRKLTKEEGGYLYEYKF